MRRGHLHCHELQGHNITLLIRKMSMCCRLICVCTCNSIWKGNYKVVVFKYVFRDELFPFPFGRHWNEKSQWATLELTQRRNSPPCAMKKTLYWKGAVEHDGKILKVISNYSKHILMGGWWGQHELRTMPGSTVRLKKKPAMIQIFSFLIHNETRN